MILLTGTQRDRLLANGRQRDQDHIPVVKFFNRVFRLDAREYCHYAEWTAHGARAHFFGHIDSSGDDLIMKAHAMIAREIADGLWS